LNDQRETFNLLSVQTLSKVSRSGIFDMTGCEEVVQIEAMAVWIL